MTDSTEIETFHTALNALCEGYQEGLYAGERWGVTVTGKPGDGVRKLYAERLAGGDHVSFNLYTTTSGAKLKPCEMAEAKVVAFVLGFAANTQIHEHSRVGANPEISGATAKLSMYCPDG